MPRMPSFQPSMTWPGMVNENGCPRVQEASNTLPSDHDAPTYCTVTLSPAFTLGPVPLTRSRVISTLGGCPAGLGIFGSWAGALEICEASLSTSWPGLRFGWDVEAPDFD